MTVRITRINGTRLPPVRKGEARAWMRCKRCGWTGYYDYVPFSFGTPIMVMGCPHSFYDDAESITEAAAVSAITAYQRSSDE